MNGHHRRRGPLMRRAAEPRRRAGSQPGPAVAPISGCVSGPILLVTSVSTATLRHSPANARPMRAGRGPMLGHADSGARRVVLTQSPDIIVIQYMTCARARRGFLRARKNLTIRSVPTILDICTPPTLRRHRLARQCAIQYSVWLHVMSPMSIWPEVGRWGQGLVSMVQTWDTDTTPTPVACRSATAPTRLGNGGTEDCTPAFVVFKRWPRLTESGESRHTLRFLRERFEPV